MPQRWSWLNRGAQSAQAPPHQALHVLPLCTQCNESSSETLPEELGKHWPTGVQPGGFSGTRTGTRYPVPRYPGTRG
eukprot:2490745-Rhodomonas_salina.1